MKLINGYIQEVTRRLPEKSRDDITLELESAILDMLPEDYTEADVVIALEQLGNPATLSAGYKDNPMHLIGPKFYDTYLAILKLVMLIVGIIVFITFFIEIINENSGNEQMIEFIVTLIGGTIFALIQAAIQAFFWVTLVFIILERTVEPSIKEPLTLSGKPWTPADLTAKMAIPFKKTIKISEAIFGLLWTVIGITLYFNAAYVVGIYSTTDNLTFIMPLFNQEVLLTYLLIVVISMTMELAKYLYMLIVRQWTWKLAISNTIFHLFGFIVILIIALDSNLFNPDVVPYIANALDASVSNVNQGVNWFVWITVAIIFVTGVIDSINGIRKARIK